MGAELGRISGPLLSANLLRNGVDLAFETDLLYFDVNNGRIGINTDAPTRTLLVNNTVNTTNLIVDTQLTVDNFIISTNRIQHQSGIIYVTPNQLLNPTVVTDKLGTLNLRVSDALIENITNNSNIEISPSGSGKVNFDTDRVYIDGSLHATGNITWDGDVIIGDSDQDSVTFNSDINSNIIPNLNDTYDLGTSLKRWNKLYSDNVEVSNNISTTGFTANNIDLLSLTGKTIYVSENGNNTNLGKHYSNPVRTIKYALSIASANDEIVIFPGTYVEEFPLIVPQGVSVRGTGIRSVTIEPTVLTKDKDCFLLNGDTTVQFVTIQNFFYNSTNNTGYAFKFAQGFKTLFRSPYIYNITVITKGSVTTVSDPLGFNQGDAGGGAYLDGSVADPTGTIPPTGLFFSTTFITPNQDGITALNGARIEWLNSFTYYAKRGIYLLQGTAGLANQGLVFGAEMRSINSANVYGTFGAVADGANTLGYLIGHNFGYIGTGANNLNDRTTVVQANEIVESNNGKIYFDSMDHKGDYRVGDVFYVNQETGQISFDAQSIDISGQGNITLESPTSTTTINKDFVETGNIRFQGNTILSLAGSVNLSAFSGSTYLNTNVFVTGNTSITGNTIVKGTVFLGNNPLDLISIAPDLTQHIVPKFTNTFTLGTDNGITPKRWDDLYTGRLDVDGVIEIDNNTVQTLTGNTNLILDAAGSGKVKIEVSDVDLAQKLNVTGVTTLANVNVGTIADPDSLVINAVVNQTGNIIRTGDTYIIGDFKNNNIKILSPSYFEVPNIRLQGSTISVTASNTDLNFTANGTGGVRLENLKIVNNTISNAVVSPTTDAQRSIYLQPNGTGNAVINSTKSLQIPVGSNLTRVLSTNGEIRLNSTNNFFEGFQQTGTITFNDIYDADKNTYVRAGATDNTLYFGINTVQKAKIDTTSLFTDTYHIDNISLNSNTINNRISGNDLIITANGTGRTNVNGIGFGPDSNITNLTNNALVLQTVGTGYVSFAAGTAIMFPMGVSAERRATPEVGETRYSTEKEYLEVYTGDITKGENGWVPAIGADNTIVDANLVEGLLDFWTLVLG